MQWLQLTAACISVLQVSLSQNNAYWSLFPSSIWVEMFKREANVFVANKLTLMFILPFPLHHHHRHLLFFKRSSNSGVFLTAVGLAPTFGGCQPPATHFSSREWGATMRVPPARSATAAAVCTPSVPPCPTSSCVRVRAARRGRRPSTEEPRVAEAPVPLPARH